LAGGEKLVSRPERRFGFQLPWLAILFGALAGSADAQPGQPEHPSTRSASGQFFIQDQRSSGPRAPESSLAANRNLVRLEPTLVTVSCERIKQMLWQELGATAPWRGKIYLVVFRAQGPNETITLVSERFASGWQYRVDLPDVLDRTRYVRAMVQVLLLEMANREAGQHSAEIPLWLSEGLSQQLFLSRELEIILPPPRSNGQGLNLASTVVSGRKTNALQQAHQQLSARAPLTFEELSWPDESLLAGESGELYRGSSQLFVDDLLRLKDGPACLRAMLAALPRYYNWQFAFLRGFDIHFARTLDVEKWWALRTMNFTGRDLGQTWPVEESWQKLDEILHFPVQIRTGTGDLPLRGNIPLQSVIREWDPVRQRQVLWSKIGELVQLRLRVAPPVVAVVDQYHQTLATYLENREKRGSIIPFRRQAALARTIEETLKQLDALDAERESLRHAQKPVAAARSQPAATP